MFENLIATLKADKRKIVFTEGPDPAFLEAASRLKKDGLLDSILVGNVDEVKSAAAAGGFDIEGMEIIDPAAYPEMDAMVARMVELRKGKMTEESAAQRFPRAIISAPCWSSWARQTPCSAALLIRLLDTVRPALADHQDQAGQDRILLLHSCAATKDGGDELYAMGDCAINTIRF